MTKPFIHDDFMLQNDAARTLYHDYAAGMPIFDYHCHLPPAEVAADLNYQNLTQVWLYGDHYKWRALRSNGIAEQYCTGDASDEEKFMKWSETVPRCLRNPLYHWTHLELKRYFDIDELLSPATAKDIYDKTAHLLHSPEFSTRNLMRKMNVKVVCTTDDPVDSLEHHQQIAADGFEIKVLPTWRPDKAMAVTDAAVFNTYLDRLAAAAGIDIRDFASCLDALRRRHEYFHARGCRLSDHGLNNVPSGDYTEIAMKGIFSKIRSGKELSLDEVQTFTLGMLVEFGIMDAEKGWTQQFHIGPIRNNNTLKFQTLGPDAGFDSIGDDIYALPLSRFLDRLARQKKLTKTILYNINPRDNYLMATMIGNFQDDTIPGKIQFGSGWWFLDQKEGMSWQLNALSNLGLLSRFVGMLTDSRSFLSYPRHEYFRRILCNLLGEDIEKGELPHDIPMIGRMVQDICFNNARDYFGIEVNIYTRSD